MRRINVLLFLLYGLLISAQEFNQTVVNSLQDCIKNNNFDKGDSIIDSYRDKELPSTSVFWLNLIHSEIGVSRYRQSEDINDYKKYSSSGINAFKFLSHNINKENAANSIDCWDFLFYWTKIYTQLDSYIIDSLSVFSNKYYNDYERKNPTLYYLIQKYVYDYYFNKQKWSKSIEVMSDVERALRKEDAAKEILALSQFDIGLAYMNMKDYSSSEKYLLSSYNNYSTINNRDEDETFGDLLILLSALYDQHISDAEKAYIYALEAENTNKILFGKETRAYVTSLAYLSNSELRLNKTNEGVRHLENLVSLLDQVPDMNETEKQSYREKLSIVNLRLNRNNDVVLQDTIETENTILLEATNAYSQGNLQEAIYKLSYLLKKYESDFKSVDISNYVYVAGSLSNAYVSLGEYTEADNVLNKAIELFQVNKIESSQIRGLFEAKGRLFFTINNIDMALNWFNKAKDMYNKSETGGLQYAMLTSNLSSCYFQKNELSLARQLSDEAYNACLSAYGENAENANDRLLILNNIANLYVKTNDTSKAKDVYNSIIRLAVTPQTEKTKALALANLGELYWFYEQNNEEAEKTLRQVREIDAEPYVKEMAELNLQILHCLNKDEEAISGIMQINENIKAEMMDVFSHFSEAEREDYWTQKSQMLVMLNNIALTSFDNRKVNIMAYDNALYTKGMLLNSGRLLESVAKQASPEIKKDLETMKVLKKALSNKSTPKDSIGQLIEDISLYEKKIIGAIPDFGEKLKAEFKSMDDIKAMLSNDDVAIEFVFLPRIKFPFEESELQYGALLISKESDAPTLIPLCYENELEDLFDVDNSTSQDYVDNLYSAKDGRLYNKIWAKIEPYLSNVKTVYYSPTGYISKINISAISDGTSRLYEKYDIYEVSTTAMIGETKQNGKEPVGKAVLFGDINYFEDSEMMAENAKKYKYSSSGNLLATRSLDRNTWDLLPGTKDEITCIDDLMKSKDVNSYVISQNNASEESFKAMDGNAPDVIHIATHGFYLSQNEDITSSFFGNLNSYTQKDYSMFFSGLLFAGANNVWTGKELTNGVEDGILTAEELSRIDLDGCKLVVLSACNTGLGDVDNIDGVFGLQRGFKKAGVSTILMSLWKVPDEETNILMQNFYHHYLSGKSAHQSLRLAQEQLIKAGKNPYYWAGFILLD